MSHTHTHTHNYTSANKDHFDHAAESYDDVPLALERARRSAEAMRKSYPFDEDTTTILDYACGTGLISRELAPYSKSIVGVDISQGMVNQFNKRVENQGITPDEMRAVCIELNGEEGELDGAKFDVIVCASAYHHFTSIEDVTRILAFFLKPAGALLVVDLAKLEKSDHGIFPDHVHHIVPHKGGFEEADIRTAFEGAGLSSFSFNKAISAKKNGHDVKLFIAKGVKPPVS